MSPLTRCPSWSVWISREAALALRAKEVTKTLRRLTHGHLKRVEFPPIQIKSASAADDPRLVSIIENEARRLRPRFIEAVLRLCVALGVIVGLVWGL